MSLYRTLARRVALGVVAVWTVLSLVFVLFTVPRNYHLYSDTTYGRNPGTTPEVVEELEAEYFGARGLDRPLREQYVDWMGNMATLQWGQSFESGREVFPMVVGAVIRTASYVLPALALAAAIGVVVALYAGLRSGSVGDGALRSLSYLSFGLPNFWLGYVIVSAAAVGVVQGRSTRWASESIPPAEGPFLVDIVLPIALVTTTLLAAAVSYGRAYALQYRSSQATKLVRAKGGGRIDVARHVLRNAAIPLVSLLFAETIALLALSVFVIETLFAIDGLGLLFYNAVWTRDLPILMGGTMAIVVLGIVGTALQDVAYSLLDPRVDTGAR